MITTVVGSYPILPKRSVKDLLLGKFDPYQNAIAQAVLDQIKAGIDWISDGQVREDMIRIFADKIDGINENLEVTEEIFPPPSPITVRDLIFTEKILVRRNSKAKVKGIITGPSTMARSLKIEKSPYKDRVENLIMDLAVVLRYEAKKLEQNKAVAVQIDEPVFSTGTADLTVGIEAVEFIAKQLNIPVSLHVCGDVRDIFIDLLDVRHVDYLDHEFAGNPKNLDLLELDEIRQSGKKIGFGCIDTKTSSVEDVDFIYDLIKLAVSRLGKENIILDPDCGMRLLHRDVAFKKLKNLVTAKNLISNSLKNG